MAGLEFSSGYESARNRLVGWAAIAVFWSVSGFAPEKTPWLQDAIIEARFIPLVLVGLCGYYAVRTIVACSMLSTSVRDSWQCRLDFRLAVVLTFIAISANSAILAGAGREIAVLAASIVSFAITFNLFAVARKATSLLRIDREHTGRYTRRRAILMAVGGLAGTTINTALILGVFMLAPPRILPQQALGTFRELVVTAYLIALGGEILSGLYRLLEVGLFDSDRRAGLEAPPPSTSEHGIRANTPMRERSTASESAESARCPAEDTSTNQAERPV